MLLEKPGKRAVTIDADFVGFVCPDVFVVGYGMDAAHAFRQLPFVGVVDYGVAARICSMPDRDAAARHFRRAARQD